MYIFDFIDSLSKMLRSGRRRRMRAAHRSVARSVTACCNGVAPSLKEVYTKDFLHTYQEYLVLSGLKRNTISFYMSTLRSLYRIAVERKLVKPTFDLFSGVFTGSDPTEKRAIGTEVIAVLQHADLSDNPRLERCRDLFMLSFYLHGMPFVDLVHLLKSDMVDEFIVYRRRKTGGLITVPVSSEARELINKYAAETAVGSPYLLPIITLTGEEACTQYDNALHKQNRQLKALAAHLGITQNLTSYVARHSWATIAYHSGVRVSVVSQAMGHQTEEVTRVYLSSFEKAELWGANHSVMAAISNAAKKLKPDGVNDVGKVHKKEKRLGGNSDKKCRKKRTKSARKHGRNKRQNGRR